MNDDLIIALREDAEWAEANIYEVPICLPDHMREAADALGKMRKLPTEGEN